MLFCCRCEAFTYDALGKDAEEEERSGDRHEGITIKPDPDTNHLHTAALASTVSVGS